MISSPSPVSIIIYHFRIKMNRTGQSLGRILTNSFFKKFEILPSTSLVYRNYHPASSRQEILKFAPSHICFEPNRRFFFSTKDTKADGAKNETIEEEVKEVSENEKVLQEKLAEVEEKNSDLLDKYKRSLADFENLRNRMNRQVADAKMFGIQGFCKVVTTISYLLFLWGDCCRICSTWPTFSTKPSALCQRPSWRSLRACRTFIKVSASLNHNY